MHRSILRGLFAVRSAVPWGVEAPEP